VKKFRLKGLNLTLESGNLLLQLGELAIKPTVVGRQEFTLLDKLLGKPREILDHAGLASAADCAEAEP
jgi:hypothetical protein